MPAPAFTVQDFATALQRLLPRGRVWTADPSSTQTALLTELAQSFQRLAARGAALLIDAFPATTSELLPEWEASLGLPDPCVGPGATDKQRRAQVLGRLTDTGGVSALDFIAFAATLGFTITIATYTPFRVGRNSAGQALRGPAWSFTWGVTVLANSGGLDPSVLICEFRARAPAHTSILLLS